MYVYDEANALAKAIRESKEYLDYKKAKEEIRKHSRNERKDGRV